MPVQDTLISSTLLNSGETGGLCALEITSIPDVHTLLNHTLSAGDLITQYTHDMGNFLTEVYQHYCQNNKFRDISLELLWLTEPAVNQPYKANIRLFLILRALDNSVNSVNDTLKTLQQICQETLRFQKYEFVPIKYEVLSQLIFKVHDTSIKALVKEERMENLQNQILPVCFSFDRLSESTQDLSRIANALIDYPDCAVSFQLIPTEYTPDEIQELTHMTQVLNVLHKGVMEQGIGNVSFSFTEKQLETYKYYADHKSQALFTYNIIVYGKTQETDNIATRVYGQLNADASDAAHIKFIELDAQEVLKDYNFYPLPWAVHELLLNRDRNPQLWNNALISSANYRFPYIITAQEASTFFRLPLGSERISAGFVVNSSEKSQKTYSDHLINSSDIEIGVLKSSSQQDAIGLSLNDLTRHMLVVGTPGSGKTTFSVSLLDRLWKEHHIPFLVIEPAKNEYRALVQSIPDLQVFTPGKNFISPFIFNPFVPPKNVKLETYKSTLKTAFSAAVSMSTPLDLIFEDAIHNCYSDFRWLDTYTSEDNGQCFNITDFIKCFQKTFDDIGYTGDAKNIGRAGAVRLNSLVNLFDNYHSIPIEDLLQKPTIIELAAIENSDQKALIIALLLLSIQTYVGSNYLGDGTLKNVILLEEAHVLFDANTSVAQGDASPGAIAQNLIKRMLAEIRAYGIGLVIADQSPRKVTADVVGLTDIKLAFRLVEAQDKLILSDSTNMSESQFQRLSRLKPGEAFLYFHKLDEPEEIKTPDYRLEHNIDITLSDDDIRKLSTYWNDKGALLRPYPECGHIRYCCSTCMPQRRILAKEVARRIFVSYFKANDSDISVVKDVFARISHLVMNELNGETFTPELLACVKVHLWRRIKYGTKIPIRDLQIQHSLENA